MNATCPGPANSLRAGLLFCLASLAACSSGQAPDAGQGTTARPQPEAGQIDLNGRWRILSIDGRPPTGPAEGERAPSLVFSNYNFGGTAGCNDFGGLGLLADGHFAIHSLGSTL